MAYLVLYIKTLYRTYHLLFWIAMSVASFGELRSQQVSFRHIGSAQGMLSTTSWNCTIDKHGFFWLATGDGLVRFNGKQTTNYFHSSHPGLPIDQIGFVYCDSRNQIWACTEKGLVRIDENRQFNRQVILENDPEMDVNYCFEDQDRNIYAFTAEGTFMLPEGNEKWIAQPWLDSLIAGRYLRDIRRFDKDRYTLVFPSEGVFLFNLKEKRQDGFIGVKGINCAGRFGDNSVLIGKSGAFGLLYASFDEPENIIRIARPPHFQGNTLHEEINYLTRAVDGRVYITTVGEGLLSIDSTLTTYTHYTHDPANPSTINSNSLRYIVTDTTGSLLFSSVDGVNYTNVLNNSIEYVNYLKVEDGDIRDDRVIGLTEDKHGYLWCCTGNNVYQYDPLSKKARSIYIPDSGQLKSKLLAPNWAECDGEGKLWVALRGEGIALFNAEGIFLKLLTAEDFPGWNVSISRARIIKDGKDGFVYIGTERGLFRINKKDFSLDTFPEDRALAPLKQQRIVDILPVSGGLWVSSSPGGAAWYYSFSEKKLKSFDSRNGLPSNRVYGLTTDGTGNIYIGSYNGFSILQPNDSIKTFTKGNGLISPRIESLETADDGSVWMTNNYNLLKYDPISGDIVRVGGRQGVVGMNFAVMASAKLASGKLAFGVHKGFVIVDPAAIKLGSDSINVFAFYQDEFGREVEWVPGQVLNFKYKHQNIRFSFAVNDMMIADQVSYRYRFASDKKPAWSNPSNNEVIDFNLYPGFYKLEVEAFDGHTWFELPSLIQIRISAPWWSQWWFIILISLSLIGGVSAVVNRRFLRIKRELALSQQINDLESKALKAQMNPHFVFNSLNAIQECIVTGKVDEAYTYLSKFSRLLRLVLQHSDMTVVTLHEELEVLSLYISLEKLRFKDEMEYIFEIEGELDTEEIKIPPMLIQPHLENAIWHGLRNKDGKKLLKFSVLESGSDYIEVVIEDNGIGRLKAGEMRKARLGGIEHQSKGKQLSGNRIDLLKIHFPMASMQIKDLHDAQGAASGTQVILRIPVIDKKTDRKTGA